MPKKIEKHEATAPQKEVFVHRCRFVDYQPPKISALAFSHPSDSENPLPSSLLLAVGRSNGDIDIWSPLENWVHKTTLRGGRGRSIEGLVWVPAPTYQRNAPPRLFSIGSSTYLTEWDITTGLPKQHLASNAGAIWCLTASTDSSTLALGCEDGTVMLVDVAEGSFAYSRFLERQASRILSLSYHPNGKYLVGGCADSTIRVWEVDHPHGRLVAQMKVERTQKQGKKRKRKMDTVVWAVKVARDGTIVSGDSTGALKIWESRFWSLKQTFPAHDADILCIAFDNDEEVIYSSGVDRKMMRFERTPNDKWAFHHGNRHLKHDVRAMASFESSEIRYVVSGGVDGSLSVLSFGDSLDNLRVIPPIPQEQIVALAPHARLLVHWFENHVKIWRIEEPSESYVHDYTISKRYVLEMQLNEENISTAAVSPDGEYLLIATLSHCKLFQLTPDEATSKCTVKQLGTFPHGARLARFTSEGNAIVLVTPESEVQIHPFLDISSETTCFKFPEPQTFTYINKLAISPDGHTFATSSSSSVVKIQAFDDMSSFCLPRPSSAITALAFLTSEVLAVTLAEDNRLLLFEQHGASWDLHPWSQNVENMPAKICGVVDKCQGIFVVNGDIEQVWMWGANWLAWIKPNEEKVAVAPRTRDKPVNKGKREEKGAGEEMDVGEKVQVETPHWISYRYREVLLMDCVGSTGDLMEFVAVERPRHEILEDITEPRFYRHEYGT